MRKVALIFNPHSGRRRHRRWADVEAVMAVLWKAGLEASATPTRSSADAPAQVRAAIAEGCDTIFACGGDGTIHDILQGISGSNIALGVIPFGTANALAHDLGLPFSPAKAARALLAARPRRIAVGRVEYQDFAGTGRARYFTVACGMGVDAHLFYELNAAVKSHLGMTAYYAKAWHLWMTHRMQRFSVGYAETGSRGAKQAALTELLAVRIRYFGGVLRELAPGASLERNDLRAVLCRTSSRALYLLYVLRGLLGLRWKIGGIDLAHCSRLQCEYLPADTGPDSRSDIYVEADGELLGTLPATISIVPDALTILIPSQGPASVRHGGRT
jgi:diacylglycerol kinase (ATP)